MVTVSNKLAHELDEPAKFIKTIDSNSITVEFNPDDPASVQVAIRQLEAAVDSKAAPYCSNKPVMDLADKSKDQFRQAIPTIPGLPTHLPGDVRDTASRLISYREELNGRLFTATRNLAKYCFIASALGTIGLLSGNLLDVSQLIWLLREILVWVQNPSTLVLSIVFLFASLTSIILLHKRISPYEKKLEDGGYLLVKFGKSENWIINKFTGKAERLCYIEPYTFKQWWHANKRNPK